MSTMLIVTGMTCEHYEQRAAGAPVGVDGAKDATASREVKRATVEGDADTDALAVAVEGAGYDASA